MAILVAMVLISGFVRQVQWPERRQAMLQGLLFGAATLIGMANPLVLGPGLIFDARSVMISLCALFFGPLAVSVTVALALAYRIALGGVGLFTGVLVIVASAAWGLYFHRQWRSRALPIHAIRLLQLGLLVHLTELLLFLSLPPPLAWQTLQTVGLPILLAFPLLTLLMGKVLTSQDAEIRFVAALRKSEEQHRAILQTALNGFWMADLEGRLLEVNQAYVRMSGYSTQELLSMQIAELEVFKTGADVASKIQKIMISGGDRFETRHRRKDGKIFDVEISIQYLAVETGRLVAFLHDITESKKAQERLLLTANVFTHAREGIMITDATGVIVDVNDSFTRISGYGRDQALGQTPQLLSSDRHPPAFFQAMWSGLERDGQWYGEVWNRRQNGEAYAAMLNISAVQDGHGRVQNFVALFSDITAIKEHQSELEHMAHYDVLTGLPNRVLMADRLHQAMTQSARRGQQLAVVYLDLDGFKSINDSHGHELGDRLLTHVAGRMKQTLREGDTLARIGGDEFVAVLIDLQESQAAVPLLNRLLAAAAEPVQMCEVTLQISASLGVSFYPQTEALEADQLLRQADQAMYQAKLSGKNRFHFFDAEQDRNTRGHFESLERIRSALLAREFVLYFQPKVNMRMGVVIGVEVLIRWQHPERGLLAPALFLPVIEGHVLAVELGEWVIDTALGQIALWQDAGLVLPENFNVSVNVGARQLQQSNFVARLHALLAAHPKVHPAQLEIEILETSALNDLAGVSQLIEQCHRMGVLFALDDFGTGYSSLNYLKHLRVGMLKIDQSFVRDMLDDPDDLAILQGVIGLAGAFRRKVIAEGVETEAHGHLLLQMGCDLGQGYAIARPMPAPEFPQWLACWRENPMWGSVGARSAL